MPSSNPAAALLRTAVRPCPNSPHRGSIALLRVCAFLLSLPEGPAAAEALWVPRASLPAPAAGFACGVDNDHILLFGGTDWQQDVKTWSQDGWSYDPVHDRWSPLTPLPAALAHAAFGTVEGALLALGGGDADGRATATLRILAGPRAPLQHLGALPEPRIYAAAAAVDDSLYIVGGQADSRDPGSVLDSCLRFAAPAFRAESLPPYPPGLTLLAAAAGAPGNLFVFGGCFFSGTDGRAVNRADSFVYRVETRQWHSLRPVPAPRRGMAACAVSETQILLAGGYGTRHDGSEGFCDQLLLYSIPTDTYRELPSMPYAGMSPGLVVHDGTLYLFGGEDAPRQRSHRHYAALLERLLLEEQRSSSP